MLNRSTITTALVRKPEVSESFCATGINGNEIGLQRSSAPNRLTLN